MSDYDSDEYDDEYYEKMTPENYILNFSYLKNLHHEGIIDYYRFEFKTQYNLDYLMISHDFGRESVRIGTFIIRDLMYDKKNFEFTARLTSTNTNASKIYNLSVKFNFQKLKQPTPKRLVNVIDSGQRGNFIVSSATISIHRKPKDKARFTPDDMPNELDFKADLSDFSFQNGNEADYIFKLENINFIYEFFRDIYYKNKKF